MKNITFGNKLIKTVFVIVCATIAMSGCGKNPENKSGNRIIYPQEGIYPVKCEETLTLWMVPNAEQLRVASNFGDSPFSKELEKKTGISVEYVHPSSKNFVEEQLSLLLASGNMPDIIASNWYEYGAEKAIDEGLIQPLGDIIEKWAPNYKKVLSERPEVDKMLKTDKGNYYAFGFIRENKELCVYGGPIIRADWLKKLGLGIPETIDEWETMLVAFKEQLGVESPLMLADSSATFKAGMICGAFGVTDGFYVDNGVVKYGPIQSGYKDFLILMKNWYDRGLLDKNFPGADAKIIGNAMLDGKVGATYQMISRGMGAWLETMRERGNTEFDLVGAPYPVLKKGETPKFSQMDWQYTPLTSWAITADCKNVELAARLLDYGYSEEGYYHFNYGTEGLTFEMKDGKPAFTEYALNNPDGLTLGNILTRYAMASSSGPCLQSAEMERISRAFPQQSEAINNWRKTAVENHMLPVMDFTQEESDELSTILADLHSYQDEMLYGFILGTENIGEWEEYIIEMEKIGAVKATKIYQAAFDRYMSRR